MPYVRKGMGSLMLASIGANGYFAQVGAPPSPITKTFQQQIGTALLTGGNHGGFKGFVAALFIWMGTL